jgi:ATP-binding protein involved in chromosome partitioning
MVGDVDVRDGRVRVAIRLTIAGCPLKAEIQRRVSTALVALPGVDAIEVTMDAMSDEERHALRAGLTGGSHKPSPFQAGSRTTVIGVASGKGGVGKSSITANLAVAHIDVAHHPEVDDAAVELGVVDLAQDGECGLAGDGGIAHMNILA